MNLYFLLCERLPLSLRSFYVGHHSASYRKVFCMYMYLPCRVGLVGSVSASHTVGREFASRPGHTKDHHKNGTNCLPA